MDCLKAFYEKTGVPIVCNTSFNLKGAPLVNTPEDAITCSFRGTLTCLLLAIFSFSKRPNNVHI
jgi:carbamoyltransferase